MNKPLTHDMLDVLYRVYAATRKPDADLGRLMVPPSHFTPALPARTTQALVRRGYLARVGKPPALQLFVTERGQGYIQGFLEAGALHHTLLRSVRIRFEAIDERTPREQA